MHLDEVEEIMDEEEDYGAKSLERLRLDAFLATIHLIKEWTLDYLLRLPKEDFYGTHYINLSLCTLATGPSGIHLEIDTYVKSTTDPSQMKSRVGPIIPAKVLNQGVLYNSATSLRDIVHRDKLANAIKGNRSKLHIEATILCNLQEQDIDIDTLNLEVESFSEERLEDEEVSWLQIKDWTDLNDILYLRNNVLKITINRKEN